MNELEGKRILVTGGTGSLGQTLVKRILTGEMGRPEQITVFSRDEAKQHWEPRDDGPCHRFNPAGNALISRT